MTHAYATQVDDMTDAYATQVAHTSKAKQLARLPDICLVDNRLTRESRPGQVTATQQKPTAT